MAKPGKATVLLKLIATKIINRAVKILKVKPVAAGERRRSRPLISESIKTNALRPQLA